MESSRFNYDYLRQIPEISRLIWWSFKKKDQVKDPKSILIINTCLIGDITASIPALSQFIKNRPDASIDLIIPPPMKTVIEKVKGVNKVYVAKSVSNRDIESIKFKDNDREEIMKKDYDQVIIIRLSKDAHDILKTLKFKEIKVFPISYFRYLLHLFKHIIYNKDPRYKGKVKQYSEVNFEWIGETQEPKNMKFTEIFDFSNKDYENIKKMNIMQGDSKKIIIHAGTGWKKNWENEKWIELLKKINKLGDYKFIFIGGEQSEQEDFEKIQKKLGFKTYSLIKKIDLKELLLIMRLSDYFIGIDSGPRNMAHLAELRSISLLGPGPKHFMPTNKRDIVIDKSDCKCTHLFCFKDGICMKNITVENVLSGFMKMALKEPKNRHKTKNKDQVIILKN